MAQAPITPFPSLPSPMPFMPSSMPPGFTQEAEKYMRENMDKAMIELFKSPSEDLKSHLHKCIEKVITSEKFLNKMKTKLSKMLKDSAVVEEDEEEEIEKETKDYVCCLMHMISKYHEEIDEEERGVKEVEKEIKEKIKDITGSESRVLAVLLRSDGIYALSHMIGMEPDEFMEHLKELGKKVHKYHHEHEEK